MSCEMPSCYVMTSRTARKQHKCCECRGFIQIGERYHYHSGVWDGKPASFKVCPECDELRDYMDEGVPFDEEKTGLGDIAGSLGNGDNWRELFKMYADIQTQRGAVVSQRILDELAEVDA